MRKTKNAAARTGRTAESDRICHAPSSVIDASRRRIAQCAQRSQPSRRGSNSRSGSVAGPAVGQGTAFLFAAGRLPNFTGNRLYGLCSEWRR
ncbi:hypothetical protein [Azospirillum endophyticum]